MDDEMFTSHEIKVDFRFHEGFLTHYSRMQHSVKRNCLKLVLLGFDTLSADHSKWHSTNIQRSES